MPFADNRGQSIYFEDAGAGPAVVLGHSFLCSGRMWCEQLAALSPRHRVLIPDFRGHGESAAVTHPFSLYDAVADVISVLDHAGVEKAVWCGLSIGGMVALRAALLCPQRISALVLMDTDAGAESALRKTRYAAMGLGIRLAGTRLFAAPVARLMFGATTHRHKPELVRHWKEGFAALHVPSVLHGLDALLARDSLYAQLDRVRIPALVLVGEEDRALPPERSRRIHRLLPQSRFVQVPGAGHLASLEQPDFVNSAILEFLEAQAPQG